MKTKLETFVNFPLNDFDLTKYVANKKNSHPLVYELYAVANHYGNMGSGHYTAHVKVFSYFITSGSFLIICGSFNYCTYE